MTRAHKLRKTDLDQVEVVAVVGAEVRVPELPDLWNVSQRTWSAAGPDARVGNRHIVSAPPIRQLTFSPYGLGASSVDLTLWKSYLLSWRTKLAKFECLKCFGRIDVVNWFMSCVRSW